LYKRQVNHNKDGERSDGYDGDSLPRQFNFIARLTAFGLGGAALCFREWLNHINTIKAFDNCAREMA
jgi:hypothetical protein